MGFTSGNIHTVLSADTIPSPDDFLTSLEWVLRGPQLLRQRHEAGLSWFCIYLGNCGELASPGSSVASWSLPLIPHHSNAAFPPHRANSLSRFPRRSRTDLFLAPRPHSWCEQPGAGAVLPPPLP